MPVSSRGCDVVVGMIWIGRVEQSPSLEKGERDPCVGVERVVRGFGGMPREGNEW